MRIAALVAVALASASVLAAGASATVAADAVRARGEQIIADFQQAACSYQGQSFSSLTRAPPAADWNFSTSDKRYTWCGDVCTNDLVADFTVRSNQCRLLFLNPCLLCACACQRRAGRSTFAPTLSTRASAT
jgi:hypothetical protein